MTTSRYPSSADLAAFRASLLAPSLRRSGEPIPDPMHGGAWEHERAEGIGATGNLDPYKRARLDGVAIHARREASAMRSRAFDRIFGDGVTWPEVTTFAPEPYGEDTLSCDVCGHFESAADLTPDWNGETGAHRSCETR